MRINQTLLRTLRAPIEEALKKIGEDHGIALHLGSASFTSYEFTFKLKGEVLDTGEGKTVAESDWAIHAPMMGIDVDKLGKQFTHKGSTFRITGVKPNRPKYPIQAININTGNPYKFPATVAERAA